MGCGASKGDAAASVSHLKLDRHRSKELWSDLRRRLHIGSDLENAVARDDLFTLMDIQRKGRLTFPQILDGCDRIIGLPELTDNIEPIVARAFKAACAQDRKKGRTISINMRKELNNTIERSEFLAFLTYVRDYFELWVMFDEVDSSDDFAITLDEFKAAIPLIEKWGRGVRIKDPVAKFNEIDTNNTKSISFIEFAEWAIIEQLDFDGDDDDKGAVAPPPSKVEPDYLAMIQASVKKKESSMTKFEKLKASLPLHTEKEDVNRRMLLFAQFDITSNRRLTLSEVVTGCKNVLHLGEYTSHVEAVAGHAFVQARRCSTQASVQADTTVSFLEFRLLLCFIYDYFELMYMFSLIDSNDEEVDGATSEAGSKITRDELRKGVHHLSSWLNRPVVDIKNEITATGDKNEEGVDNKEKSPLTISQIFGGVDTDGNDEITFMEFVSWAVRHKLDADGRERYLAISKYESNAKVSHGGGVTGMTS